MKIDKNQNDTLIPLKEFMEKIGYKSTSSYYQMLKNDITAPQPIKLLGRKVFLSSYEVENWIESKKATRGL